MSAQPEALRLAHECQESAIEWRGEIDTRLKAAAELRRMHAENEALRKDLKTEHALSFRDQVASLQAENEAKDALLRQALGALEFHQEQTRPIHRTQNIIATIKQHLGQKGETK